MMIRHSSVFLGLVLCVCTEYTSAEEVIAKEQILRAISKQYTLFEGGLFVKYHVQQEILSKNDPFDSVHIGNEKLPPSFGKFWKAEHAWKGDANFSLTTLYPEIKDDPHLSIRINDGKRKFRVSRESDSLVVFQGNFQKEKGYIAIPEEELYKEVLGMESTRQNIGITFRGLENPNPYDIIDILNDSRVKIISELEDDFVFLELPGQDRIWLRPSCNYALVQRERNWGGNLPIRARIDNTDFKEIKEGIWLPMKSTITYYSNPNVFPHVPCVKSVLMVDELTLSLPKYIFVPEVEQGTLVDDLENHYLGRMPALDKNSLDKFFSNPHLAEHYVLENRFWFFRVMLISLGVILVLAAVLYKYYVYYKKKKP